MYKVVFYIIVIVGTVISSLQVYFVVYNNVKVQSTFDGVVTNQTDLSSYEIKKRLNKLLLFQQVSLETLPDDFFSNLTVSSNDGVVKIGSKYSVTIWFLGQPNKVLDSNIGTDESSTSLIEKMRTKARIDFDFAPYAESP